MGPAQAAAAEAKFERTATPGPSRLLLNGQVIYLGATAPLHQTSGPPPTLPVKDFLAVAAVAGGR